MTWHLPGARGSRALEAHTLCTIQALELEIVSSCATARGVEFEPGGPAAAVSVVSNGEVSVVSNGERGVEFESGGVTAAVHECIVALALFRGGAAEGGGSGLDQLVEGVKDGGKDDLREGWVDDGR